MNKFKERYKLPKQTQEETEWLNKPIISSKEVELVINKLPTKKSPGPDGFIHEFYQVFEEISILRKHFQKTVEERIFSNLLYEVSIRWKPKLNKDIRSKENHKPISLMNRHKNL